MSVSGKTKQRVPGGDGLIQCLICGDYFAVSGGFSCPTCRRGPLCRRHRASGSRECVSCILDIKVRTMNALRGQEKSIRNFVRFIQFIFLVFAVFFIAAKFGFLEEVGFLQQNLFIENAVYVMLAAGVIYAVSFMMELGQRRRIVDLESEILRMGILKY